MKGWYGNKYGHSLASKGIRTKSNYSCGIKSYGEWIKGVDNEFWKYIGLGVHDMRDYMWRDLYDDTLTPREAFRSFVEDNLDEFGDAGWEIMRRMDEEDEKPDENTKLKEFKQFRVGVVDENGREYIEYFDNEEDAYERWLEYRGAGDETWYSKLISTDVGEYETVEMYDPDRDEDGEYWGSVISVMKLLKKESIDPNYASPNFVKDFADNRGISLTSDEVVRISNTYDKHYESHGEEKKSPTAKNLTKETLTGEQTIGNDTFFIQKTTYEVDGRKVINFDAMKTNSKSGKTFALATQPTKAEAQKYLDKEIKNKVSPTAKNINKTISNVEKSASRTAEDINITKKKVGEAIDRSASKTAEDIKEARERVGKRIDEGKSKTATYFKKLGKRFDDSATDTAKFLKRQSKRIDDSASETAKHMKKTFEVKKDE